MRTLVAGLGNSIAGAMEKLVERDVSVLKLQELNEYQDRNRSGSSKSTMKAQSKRRAKAKAARKARKK